MRQNVVVSCLRGETDEQEEEEDDDDDGLWSSLYL